MLSLCPAPSFALSHAETSTNGLRLCCGHGGHAGLLHPLRRHAADGLHLATGSAKVNGVANATMFRIHGDRQSLLAALACHWVDQQLGIPAREVSTSASPAPNQSSTVGGKAARR